MSIKVMTRVWDESTQKGGTLLLLLALADHAADDGFCWPGQKTLAKKIRMSGRSVARKIQELEDAKELYVIRQNGEHNWYIVRVGMSDEDVIETLKKRKMDTPDNLSPVTHVSLPDDKAMPQPMTELCHPNLHEPSENHQENTPSGDSPFGPLDDEYAGVRDEPEPPPNPAQQRLASMRSRLGADPLAVMATTKAKRDTLENPDWTDATRDGDDWTDKPLAGFMALAHRDTLKPKEREHWPRKLQEWAEEWRATPEETYKAIRAIPESEFSWQTFKTPYSRSFLETMDAMIDRIRSGTPINAKGTASQNGAREPHTPMGVDMVVM